MGMPDLTALGNQIVAYEVTITAILQVLAYADPAIGQAIAQAMRDNNKKVPTSFLGVKERVDEYIGLIESQVAQRSRPGLTS
jgi:hypothetical protein